MSTGTRFVATAIIALAAMLVTDLSLEANRAGERRIAFYNIHTKETVDVVYKRNGRRIPAAMERINWIMRDWRQDQSRKMDPQLIDIIWEMHTELGSRAPVHIISGYRSPKTNTMLRKTRGGQARRSRHMTGQAADVHFPDVPIKRLRYSAMVRQRGGVGYYPTSAIPFVHVDTGRVRHWPRMVRDELALLFPNGRTKHRPKGNKPISRSDVTAARKRRPQLAREVASFHTFRRTGGKSTQTRVAANTRPPVRAVGLPGAWGDLRIARADAPRAVTPPRPPRQDRAQGLQLAALPPDRIASRGANGGQATGGKAGIGAASARQARVGGDLPREIRNGQSGIGDARTSLGATPRLQASPRLVVEGRERSAGVAADALPSKSNDSERLTNLFTLASLFPLNSWFSDAKKAPRPASITEPSGGRQLSGERFARYVQEPNTFVTAPAFDEEHPEELYYRPFALAPLLTASPSPDDPVLATLLAPDPAETLTMLDEEVDALPMRFRPKTEVAARLWQNQFTGAAVQFGAAPPRDQDRRERPQGLANRAVATFNQPSNR
ncbi:MAG: DUF882 domain-containing protein [Pseudomonadota bacterium]